METQQLIDEINALPPEAREAIEQLVQVLRQQPAQRRQPPIIRPASPLTEEERLANQQAATSWADRADITDGAQYIHEVRRGLRQP